MQSSTALSFYLSTYYEDCYYFQNQYDNSRLEAELNIRLDSKADQSSEGAVVAQYC